MKEAFEVGQTGVIAQMAHKLKGSAGVIETMEMYHQLYRIENVANTAIINDTLKTLLKKHSNCTIL